MQRYETWKFVAFGWKFPFDRKQATTHLELMGASWLKLECAAIQAALSIREEAKLGGKIILAFIKDSTIQWFYLNLYFYDTP